MYIADEYDLTHRHRSYSAKFNVVTVDKILEELGGKVERPIKINGKHV